MPTGSACGLKPDDDVDDNNNDDDDDDDVDSEFHQLLETTPAILTETICKEICVHGQKTITIGYAQQSKP